MHKNPVTLPDVISSLVLFTNLEAEYVILAAKNAGTRPSLLTMNKFTLPLTLMGFMLLIGCTSSSSSKNREQGAAAPGCTEPENPYDEGTGHYAGYEWAESNGGACGGSSQSFNEGCEEYERQESEYQECEAQKKK